MKESAMKRIKNCYGDKEEFMQKGECSNCPFKKKCLLKVNKMVVYDVYN